jgi:hypothetical protein
MNNISTGELLNFTVNIWMYIQNVNNKVEEQTLLVIGDVIPYNKSITLSIKKTEDDEDVSGSSSFKLSLKHYPSNMTLNDYLFEKNTWYNIVYVKTIRDNLFYVGVFVSVVERYSSYSFTR